MSERTPRIPCTSEEQQDCPLKHHVYNTHHKYFPRNVYVTPLEQEFRELPDNKVKMCTYLHNVLHKEEYPPPKPGVSAMLEAVMRIEE